VLAHDVDAFSLACLGRLEDAEQTLRHVLTIANRLPSTLASELNPLVRGEVSRTVARGGFENVVSVVA